MSFTRFMSKSEQFGALLQKWSFIRPLETKTVVISTQSSKEHGIMDQVGLIRQETFFIRDHVMYDSAVRQSYVSSFSANKMLRLDQLKMQDKYKVTNKYF